MTMSHQGLGIDVEAAFKIGVGINDRLDTLTRQVRDSIDKLSANQPVLYRNIASGSTTGSTLILNLGVPDQGTYWDIESVAISGTDVNVAAAGSAGLYVAPSVLQTSPGAGYLVDRASTLPNTGFYGFRDIVVNDSEALIVVIFTPTSGQTYVVNMAASVYRTVAGGGKMVGIAGE